MNIIHLEVTILGISGISPFSLLLIFLIAVMLFGSKRLSQLGKDLGSAISSFNQGLSSKEQPSKKDDSTDNV